MRERAQLLQGLLGLEPELAEELGAALGIVASGVGGEAEPDAERYQPLLRTVVEVALDPAPLVVGGSLYPRPRLPQLPAHRFIHLGREFAVLHRGECERRGRAHELALLGQRRVVDDRGDRIARSRRPW